MPGAASFYSIILVAKPNRNSSRLLPQKAKRERDRERGVEGGRLNRKENNKAPAGTRKLETAFYARAEQMCCILLGS